MFNPTGSLCHVSFGYVRLVPWSLDLRSTEKLVVRQLEGKLVVRWIIETRLHGVKNYTSLLKYPFTHTWSTEELQEKSGTLGTND